MGALVLIFLRDSRLRNTLIRRLKKEGTEVLRAASVEECIALAGQLSPTLLILDLDPGPSWLPDICQQLGAGDLPLILILAPGGSSAEAITALETGADDYVTLPCSIAELTARIVSLLRRREQGGSPSREIQVGDLRIHIPDRQVTIMGKPVHLAPKEFQILLALAERANRVVSREELVSLVWSSRQPVKRRTFDVYMFSLRSKIEVEPSNPIRLLTVWGVGYRLVAAEASSTPETE